jgi:hypothetical protein
MRVPQIPWNHIFSSKTIFAKLNKINDMSKSGQKNYSYRAGLSAHTRPDLPSPSTSMTMLSGLHHPPLGLPNSTSRKKILMNTRTLRLCLIVALSCVTATALAENPFVGTWKIDYSQSKVTGHTVTLTSEADGKVRITQGGGSYSFKPDGSDATTDIGDTAQWTKVDDHTWQASFKRGSTPLATDTWKLSDDGKTLDLAVTGTRPNGDAIDEKESYTRIAPGKGFYGKWKDAKVSNNSPTSREIEANGDNGIVWNIPEIKASLHLKFDGKDVAPTGPTVPDGLTVSATKLGPRSFELTEKLKGKIIFKARITISADGKTMTDVGSPAGVNEPTTLVFHKS